MLAAELFLRWRLNPATWAAAAGRLPASFQDLTWDAVQTRQRIVVLGDSIAVGVGVAPAAAWPAQLQQQLDIRQPGAWAVINASVPGETALQGLLRIERDVLRWRPRLALIAFGRETHFLRLTLLTVAIAETATADINPLSERGAYRISAPTAYILPQSAAVRP